MEVTWVKAKYSAQKVHGRYKSGHNDSNKKQKKSVSKVTTAKSTPGARVLQIDGGSGKRRWVWQ